MAKNNINKLDYRVKRVCYSDRMFARLYIGAIGTKLMRDCSRVLNRDCEERFGHTIPGFVPPVRCGSPRHCSACTPLFPQI